MSVGSHVIADFWGSCFTAPESVMEILIDGAKAAGAQILFQHYHIFPNSEDAFTGLLMLSESHISIHTWPEQDLIALDIFLCGRCDPLVALREIRNKLNPTRVKIQLLNRGDTNI